MPLAPEHQSLLEPLARVPGPPIYELMPEDARAAYRLRRPRDEQLAVGAVNELAEPGHKRRAGYLNSRVAQPCPTDV